MKDTNTLAIPSRPTVPCWRNTAWTSRSWNCKKQSASIQSTSVTWPLTGVSMEATYLLLTGKKPPLDTHPELAELDLVREIYHEVMKFADCNELLTLRPSRADR